jgi:hypothetical protein
MTPGIRKFALTTHVTSSVGWFGAAVWSCSFSSCILPVWGCTRIEQSMNQNHYRHLLIMSALAFASMYVLMYAMVSSFANVYSNVNQLYMAGLMTAPMVVIELMLMRGMYHDQTRNAVIMGVSVIVGIASFLFTREQTAVSDRQFLRSMIPHHAGAILMCERAPIQDPDIKDHTTRSLRASRRRSIR